MKRLVVWPNDVAARVARSADGVGANQRLKDSGTKHIAVGAQLCAEHFNEIIVKRFFQVDCEQSWDNYFRTRLLTRLLPGGRIILETEP